MRYKRNQTALARKQIDRRLALLRKAEGLTRPPRGWIRAIRDALGMTTAQLAERIGVSQPRVVRLEKAEIEDSLTLTSLRQAAEAMDCTLIYVLLPRQPLEDLVRERAQEVAGRQLSRTHHTMKLENQAVEALDLRAERERLVDELLRGDPSRLWDQA